MKIWPVVFTCERDLDLVWLQRYYMKKAGIDFEEYTLVVDRAFLPSVVHHEWIKKEGIRLVERPDGYVPWPAEANCDSKVGGFKAFLEAVRPDDGDYVFDFDSDAFLVGTKLLEHLGKADLIGFRFTNRARWISRFGENWSHCMGALQIIRAGALRKAVSLSGGDVLWAKEWIKAHGSTYEFVHDQYFPLLLRVAGASAFYPDSGYTYCEGKQVEELILNGWEGLSLLHLYETWKSFAGIPIEGKWQIPAVLRKKGLA